MTVETVFFSDHPRVLRWARDAQAGREKFLEEIRRLEEEYPGFQVYTTSRFKSTSINGIVDLDDRDRSPGEGWRKTRERPVMWVPDKRTVPGKAMSIRLSAARHQIEQLPGMPDQVTVGMDWHTPGVFLVDRGRGGAWISWAVTRRAVIEDAKFSSTQLDEKIWTERKLSEYHAAREAQEAVNSV